MNEGQKAWKQVLDETLHAQLHHHYVEQQKMKPDEMVWDRDGPSCFVVIGFNHPLDVPVDMSDLTESDKAVAIASASSAIMPAVTPDEFGVIGPHETIKHGVQAVAAAMLLSSLQNGAILDTMKMSQGVMLKQRKLT